MKSSIKIIAIASLFFTSSAVLATNDNSVVVEVEGEDRESGEKEIRYLDYMENQGQIYRNLLILAASESEDAPIARRRLKNAFLNSEITFPFGMGQNVLFALRTGGGLQIQKSWWIDRELPPTKDFSFGDLDAMSQWENSHYFWSWDRPEFFIKGAVATLKVLRAKQTRPANQAEIREMHKLVSALTAYKENAQIAAKEGKSGKAASMQLNAQKADIQKRRDYFSGIVTKLKKRFEEELRAAADAVNQDAEFIRLKAEAKSNESKDTDASLAMKEQEIIPAGYARVPVSVRAYGTPGVALHLVFKNKAGLVIKMAQKDIPSDTSYGFGLNVPKAAATLTIKVGAVSELHIMSPGETKDGGIGIEIKPRGHGGSDEYSVYLRGPMHTKQQGSAV